MIYISLESRKTRKERAEWQHFRSTEVKHYFVGVKKIEPQSRKVVFETLSEYPRPLRLCGGLRRSVCGEGLVIASGLRFGFQFFYPFYFLPQLGSSGLFLFDLLFQLNIQLGVVALQLSDDLNQFIG